ncbi:MAG: hypothetical protein WA800_11285, partial [Terriglobales bacterium]
MNIRDAVRGAARRVGEVSLRQWLSTGLFARGRDGRRTMGTGSNLAPFQFGGFPAAMVPGAGGRGASAAYAALPKRSPVNLRRFAETPVARRAINVIKDRIAGMKWRIQARSGRSIAQIPNGALRAQILTANFEAPNPDDSFRSFVEQVLEDVIVGGFGAIELDRVAGWELPLDETTRPGGALTAAGVSVVSSAERPAELRSARTGESP